MVINLKGYIRDENVIFRNDFFSKIIFRGSNRIKKVRYWFVFFFMENFLRNFNIGFKGFIWRIIGKVILFYFFFNIRFVKEEECREINKFILF